MITELRGVEPGFTPGLADQNQDCDHVTAGGDPSLKAIMS